jgi:hypothetical protein
MNDNPGFVVLYSFIKDALLSKVGIVKVWWEDKEEIEEEESQWNVKVIQAANAAKQMGDLPAMIQRIVDEISSPVVPWREQLRMFFNQRQRDDFSWKRPKGSLLVL